MNCLKAFPIALIGAVTLITSSYAVESDNNILTIHVKGFKNNVGSAMVAVHDRKGTFLTKKEPFRRAILKIVNQEATIEFSMPSGQYSVAVFHDEDSNNDLNMKMGIIPTEDFGFSNNARGKYGPPKFKDTLFTLSKSEKLEISVSPEPASTIDLSK